MITSQGSAYSATAAIPSSCISPLNGELPDRGMPPHEIILTPECNPSDITVSASGRYPTDSLTKFNPNSIIKNVNFGMVSRNREGYNVEYKRNKLGILIFYNIIKKTDSIYSSARHSLNGGIQSDRIVP